MLKNLLSLVSAEIIGRLLGIVTTIYLARVLGVDDFGRLNFAFAIATYFTLPVNFGFNDYGIIHVSRDRSRGHLQSQLSQLLSLRLFIGAISFVTLIALTYVVPELEDLQVLLWAAGTLVIVHAVSVEWLFTAIERMTVIAASRIAGSAFYAIAVVLFIDGTSDLTLAAGFWAGREALVAAILFGLAGRQIVSVRPRIDRDAWRGTITFVLPIGLAAFIAQAHASIDLVIVGFLLDDQQLGWYAATLHIVGTAVVAKRLVVQVLLPRLAAVADSAPSVERIGNLLQPYLISLSVFIAVFGSVFADNIVDLTYGDAFSGAVRPLQIGIWRVAVDLGGVLMLNTLFVRDQVRFAVIFAIATATNVALNFALIPAFGIEGSASAYVVSTTILVLLAYREMRARGLHIALARSVGRAALAALVMGGAIAAASRIGVAAQLFAGPPAFLLTLRLSGMTLRQFVGDLEAVRAVGLSTSPTND